MSVAKKAKVWDMWSSLSSRLVKRQAIFFGPKLIVK